MNEAAILAAIAPRISGRSGQISSLLGRSQSASSRVAKLNTWQRSCTQCQQMLRDDLTVEYAEHAILHQTSRASTTQTSTRYWLCTEHRFTKKCMADDEAIEAPTQLVVNPDFDGMSLTLSMQGFERGYHSRGDPGAALVAARCGAGSNDCRECRVEAYLGVRLPGYTSPQTAREAEVARQENAAWIGRPPQYRLAVLVPWKNASAIRP